MRRIKVSKSKLVMLRHLLLARQIEESCIWPSDKVLESLDLCIEFCLNSISSKPEIRNAVSAVLVEDSIKKRLEEIGVLVEEGE